MLTIGYIRANNPEAQAAQQTKIEEWASRNNTAIELMVNAGLSALKERIEQGGVQVVVVTDIPRLTRSEREYQELLAYFEVHRIEIALTDFESSTPVAEYRRLKEMITSHQPRKRRGK